MDMHSACVRVCVCLKAFITDIRIFEYNIILHEKKRKQKQYPNMKTKRITISIGYTYKFHSQNVCCLYVYGGTLHYMSVCSVAAFLK